MKHRPVRTSMCRLPTSHTFPAPVRWISQYETRSSRYRSRTDVRSLAPSLQNLTGKRSRLYPIAPLMVELFTAGRLNRSPRRSHPGTLCRQRAAPHASRVERTRRSKPEPHGRDFSVSQLRSLVRGVSSCTIRDLEPQSEITRFARCNALQQRRIARAITSPTRPPSNTRCERGMSASPNIPAISLS